ncbi:MAG: lantibiotic biosynthesis protein, partial [Thermoanaerobaculia bacterium]|nr:lantibiotic biosynthesis protein [Thermoanaerobaculia bacterium]
MADVDVQAKRGWTPLLTGDQKAKALAISSSIIDILRRSGRAWTPPGAARTERVARDLSLAWGSAGWLIAFAYCASGSMQKAMIETHADKLADGLARHPLPPTLFRGFWGIGWTFAHMKNAGLWDVSISDDFADSVRPTLDLFSREHQHDLMHGMVGVGVYVLETIPSSGAAAILEDVVGALEAGCSWSDDGAFWPTPPELLPADERELWPGGRTDLGMAHGSAGVIAFLAATIRRARSPAATRLLEAAVSWLLAQRLPPSTGALFSAHVDGARKSAGTRLAWCAGDLGISVSLALAAGELGREDWRQEALRIALHSAARPFSDAVIDSSFCHGSAGIAHLFSRLFQYLEHPRLAEASARWYEHSFGSETIRRFLRYGSSRSGRAKRYDTGFLMGAAGVALALNAGATDAAPAWDRAFLCSTT